MKGELHMVRTGFLEEYLPIIILVIVLFFLYFILPSKMMAAEILIMAIPTLAFIFLFGYTGLLSFGMGSLFAIGAYTAGILLARHNAPIFVAILAGIVLTGLISVIIGYFCIKRGGLIFALLTLAFNQLIWFIIWQWKSFTGGPDGILGIKREALNLGIFSINLKPTFNFYIFVLILFLLVFVFTRRLIESPLGKVLVGIRENELRAKAIGYNPETYKWVSFIISGFLCGLGGALFALHQEYVGEHLANWFTSGEVIMMALVGGTFTIYGAVIGAAAFIYFSDYLNRFTVLSRSGASILVLGIIFIMVVMFFRGGIYVGAEMVYGLVRKKRLEK